MFMETSAKTAANVEEVGMHEYTHTDVHLKSHMHIYMYVASVFPMINKKGGGEFSGCTECEIVSGGLGYLICATPFVYVVNFWLSERGERGQRGDCPHSLFR